MPKLASLSLIVIAAWWAFLLPVWVETAGQEVHGTEINRTLALLPGVVVLLVLIARYGKASRVLLIAASLTSLGSGAWVLLGDLGSTPRVIELQERATGLAGGNGEFTVLWPPTVFAFIGVAVAILLLFAAFQKQVPRRSVDEKPSDEEDPRFIWDQQGN